MSATMVSKRAVTALCLAAIASAVILGIGLRMQDPSSSKVIAAEDPYTHMALVREHLRTGSFQPLYVGGDLYPPGMHALLAAAWVYTGIDLEFLVRFAPVAIGALGLLAMAVLLRSLAGWTAAFVGTLALALAPEAIFRTTMLSPTALDLALVPILLLSLAQASLGRLPWAGIAALTTLFLVLSHPWVLPIVAVAGVGFLVLALAFPWRPTTAPALSGAGIALSIAIVGGGVALAMSGCQGLCGGFGDVLGRGANPDLAPAAWATLGASLIPLSWHLVHPASLQRVLDRTGRGPPSLAARVASSLGLAIILVGLTAIAARTGFPSFVNLPAMMGWPIIVLAAAGFVALPFVASPASHLGGAMAAVTLPLVIFNPLHSAFWPHRTAVYLILGAAILCGVAGEAAMRGLPRLGVWLRARWRSSARSIAAPGLAIMPMIVVATVGAAVYEGTPPAYPGGWYRLFSPCEYAGLQEVARAADAQPKALVISGDWQSKLVVAALASDASRAWYAPQFFTSSQWRQATLASAAHDGRPVIVIVDSIAQKNLHPDVSFLKPPTWTPVGSWCGSAGSPSLASYQTQPT
jgi:hypothetical protein